MSVAALNSNRLGFAGLHYSIARCLTSSGAGPCAAATASLLVGWYDQVVEVPAVARNSCHGFAELHYWVRGCVTSSESLSVGPVAAASASLLVVI